MCKFGECWNRESVIIQDHSRGQYHHQGSGEMTRSHSKKELCPFQIACVLDIVFSILFILYIFVYEFIPQDYHSIISCFLGFYFAVIVAHYPIKITIEKMWNIVRRTGYDKKSHFDSSAIVGSVERALFVVSLLNGEIEAIGFWLVLKTAGRVWSEEQNSKAESREIFQIFLIGSALSIGYAIAGANLIKWLPSSGLYAFCILISMFVSNLVLWWLIEPFKKEKETINYSINISDTSDIKRR